MPKALLHAQAGDRFLMMAADGEFAFARSAGGAVNAMTLTQAGAATGTKIGQEAEAQKKDPASSSPPGSLS
ncbi:MAG: hypothetical protein ACR2FK_04435 [Sphingomicrobium sp.]